MYTYSITFDVVTPESAERGDFAETGFEREDVALAIEDDRTAVDAAVQLIADELGCVEPSSGGRLFAGDWFTQADAEVDYSTGAETRRSVHFKGLTDADMQAVARRLADIGLIPRRYLHA